MELMAIVGWTANKHEFDFDAWHCGAERPDCYICAQVWVLFVFGDDWRKIIMELIYFSKHFDFLDHH